MTPDDRRILAQTHATLGAHPRDAEGRPVEPDDDDRPEPADTSCGALHPAQTSGL